MANIASFLANSSEKTCQVLRGGRRRRAVTLKNRVGAAAVEGHAVRGESRIF